jgi:modulator of FtsH protease HflC
MKSRFFSLIIGILIVLVLLVYLFTFQVRPTEVAMQYTFEKPFRVVEKGWYMQFPRPIQTVKKFDRRLQPFETAPIETMTADQQPILVSLAVGWRIDEKNLNLFVQSVGSIELVEPRVYEHVQSQMTAVIGRYRLDNFVSTDPKKVKFADIEEEIRKNVADLTKPALGIDVPLIRIRQFELPESGTQAVYARMKAEREKQVAAIQKDGEAQAQTIRAEGLSAYEQIVARARAEGERIRGEGDAEAAQVYGVFDKNPELAKFLRELKSLPVILGKRTTIILDPRTPGIRFFVNEVELPKGKGPLKLSEQGAVKDVKAAASAVIGGTSN